MWNSNNNPGYYEYFSDPFHEAIYSSDEFRMYMFKVKWCPRSRSHDWTSCPFAHRSEKARRRDPRRYNYAAVICPDYRGDINACRRGDACPYAHGVFEYWLHPTKYRTRACNAGALCARKVCFFAHSPYELRYDDKFHCFCDLGGPQEGGFLSAAAAAPFVLAARAAVGGGGGQRSGGGSQDFLASLSGLTIREGEGNSGAGSGIFRWGAWEPAQTAVAEEEEGVPDIDWIKDMME